MKLRVRLLIGAAFVAGAAAAYPAAHLLGRGLVATAHAQESGATPPADNEESKKQLMNLFSQVLDRVHEDYVDPVTAQKLVYNALDGMLSGLDPHSAYMDPAQWRDMQI